MVLNIAHRGASSLAPENTIAAAETAIELGADMWEADVSVTRDGCLILVHDDSLKRTTDVERCFPDRSPWSLTDFTFGEISVLDAGSWFVDEDPFSQIVCGAVSPARQRSFRGEKIPALKDALIFTQESNFRINLELKRTPQPMDGFPVVDEVLAMIDSLKIDTNRIVISSFRHEWLNEVQEKSPGIEVQALIGYSPSAPLDWGDLEFRTYNVRSTLIDEEQIRAMVKQGISINLFTVDEEEDIRRFASAGTAGLITDFPQRVKHFIEQERN